MTTHGIGHADTVDLRASAGERRHRVLNTGAMDIYSFSRSSGHPVDSFASSFVLSPVAQVSGPSRLACFHLGAGENVGEHEAVVGQLFCVVDGEGWVSGPDSARRPLRAMEAAYWRAGERHAAGTQSGLIAFVIEADRVEVLATLAG
jgi:hypothetical protein